MARTAKEKNTFAYVDFEGQECVCFQTVGKYKYDVLVDRSAWDKYLSQFTWTVSMQSEGKRAAVKTSIDKQTVFLWRLIIEHEKDEIDYWGKTIDHINNDPLDNRLSNLRIYNAILNSTNISSKFSAEDRQYIHKVVGGYKIHYNLGGKTFYWFFGSKKYGSSEKALLAAKEYRDRVVLPDRARRIGELERKSRNIEFERGLRDKIKAGEKDEVITLLKKYDIF